MQITNSIRHAIAVVCAVLISAQAAQAQRGLYVRAGPELAHASVEHTKKVAIGGGSSSSTSSATGFSAAAAFTVGTERQLATGWLLAGELGGSISAPREIKGTISPTSSGEEHDVWPGRWEYGDKFGVGANLLFGRVLGDGGSRGYAVVGIRRMWTEVATGGTNPETGVFGEDRQRRARWPWTAGVGARVGPSPIDIRISYFRSTLDWVIEQPGFRLDYRFATSGLAFSVGLTLPR